VINMATTYTLSIPPKFWHDHADRCVSRDITASKGKNGRIVVELTGDEVADLYSDAIHYSDPGDFDMTDALAMAMSARATRKAVEAQVSNLDELDAQWSANLAAARLAFETSAEGLAVKAQAERRKAEAAARIEEARRRDFIDPSPLDLRGLMVRHEQTGNEWATVRRAWSRMSRYYEIETSRGTLQIEGSQHARASELGIEVAVLI
jgi:hypothetical protein